MDMRKITILLWGILLFCLSGCLKEEQDLFSESAAERLNHTLEKIDSLLIEAPNGWVLQYFATSESPGYPILVRFNSNGDVVVGSKNKLLGNIYTEEKSTFDVIGDNGPVLTFNTCNKVLHLFSDPVNPDGYGLGGDYEFVVESQTDSLIEMKGKKRGTEILLLPLEANLSWSDYFNQLDKIETEIFGSASMYLVSGNDTVIAYNGTSHIFEFYDQNDGSSTSVPFIMTNEGFRFYTTYLTTKKKQVKSFYLNKEKEKVISYEDAGTYFVGPSILDFFVNNRATFVFDTTQTSAHYLEPMRVVARRFREQYKGKRNFDFMAFSFDNLIGNSFMLSTKPVITEAYFKLNLKKQGNSMLTISQVDGVRDSNGALFASSVPEVDVLWEAMEGSYSLNSTISRREIRFTDLSNQSRYFVVNKK